MGGKAQSVYFLQGALGPKNQQLYISKSRNCDIRNPRWHDKKVDLNFARRHRV